MRLATHTESLAAMKLSSRRLASMNAAKARNLAELLLLTHSPSHASWVFKPASSAAPRNATGWKPVQIVPENARAGRGGFPLRVEPAQNQAVWIEVYTDRNLPAGIYHGQINVNADGQKEMIPI